MQSIEAIEVLRRSPALAGLRDSSLVETAEQASRLTAQLGDLISVAGETDDSFYIIASGKVRLVAATKSGQSVTIALLGRDQSFGENVLDSSLPVATARAAADSVVYRIPGEQIRRLAAANGDWFERLRALAAAEKRFAFLRSLDLFALLTMAEARALSSAMKVIHLAGGDILFREGEAGDSCCVIYQGALRIFKDGPTGKLELRVLGKGDVVGEIALAFNRPRTASVVAQGNSTVLQIDRESVRNCASAESFEKLLTQIASDRILQNQSVLEDARNQTRQPRFAVTSVKLSRAGWGKTIKAVTVDQPEFAAEACLRMLEIWVPLPASPAEDRGPRQTLAGTVQTLAGFGQLAEERGYLTRLLQVDGIHFDSIKLPAVVQSSGRHLQLIHSVSWCQVISAHTGLGLLRQPRADFLKSWNGRALSIEFVPRLSGNSEDLRNLPSLFLPLLRPFTFILVSMLAVALLMQALSLAEPFFSKVIVDRVVVYRDGALLRLLTFGAIAATLLQLAAGAVQQYLRTLPLVSIAATLQLNFLRHILDVSATGLAGWDTSRFFARFGENTKILDIIVQRGAGLFVDCLSIVVYILAMFTLNPRLGMIALIFMAAWALLLLGPAPWLRRMQQKLFDKNVAFDSFLLDTVAGIYTLKAIAGEERAQAQALERLRDFRTVEFRVSQFSAYLNTANDALISGATLATLGFGAVLALSGSISAGELISFQALLALTFGPFSSLVSAPNDIAELRVSMERTGEVFRLPIDKPKPLAAVKALQGQVQFRNVTFSYPGNNKPALADFSLDVRPGQKVALVGRSGSGKTTVASLLAALYEPSMGSILFDNTDQRDFDRAALRRQIGVVEQHPYIFNGSIRENIAKANPDASFEDIVTAASLAGAHTFVNDLPMGYETQIGERGITLSGGQRQRLVIARTLLNQPPILILDEATSALDTVTESIVQQNLDRVSKGRTTFVIAHRLSTVRNSDMIVVIDEGRLVEKGTHDELTALRGTYHHLYSRSA